MVTVSVQEAVIVIIVIFPEGISCDICTAERLSVANLLKPLETGSDTFVAVYIVGIEVDHDLGINAAVELGTVDDLISCRIEALRLGFLIRFI